MRSICSWRRTGLRRPRLKSLLKNHHRRDNFALHLAHQSEAARKRGSLPACHARGKSAGLPLCLSAAGCDGALKSSPMRFAIFSRDDQIQRLTKGCGCGVAEKLFRTCAPESNYARRIGNHNSIVVHRPLPHGIDLLQQFDTSGKRLQMDRAVRPDSGLRRPPQSERSSRP